jgi:hypothetical protein
MNGVLNQFGVVCALFFGVVPAIAQPLNPSSLPKIEQGKSLDCPVMQTVLTNRSVPVISEPSTPTHSLQALDGANTMMIKLIYLGLPGAILIGISLRTLHLHREIMRQRAFVESLERIWQRTVSY